jgi:predicted RNase H-like nuclease/GrpB-like predicted nucleotidyltransferase (UPF0157 family)
VPFPDEPSASRVEVSPPRDTWATEATAYVDLLRDAIPSALAVDHIGSTSVPGLAAKDCLDLMVQVADLDEAAIVLSLTRRGFRLRPESWNRVEVTDGVSHPKLVFAAPEGGRSVNVHVRVAGGRNVRHALLFRDFLRADAGARESWGAFKTRLAETVTDIYDYGQIKASVQPLLMQRAERWAEETGWRVTLPTSYEGPPVLGVDGCKLGWVGALLHGTTYDVLVAADIAALVCEARRRAPRLSVVAIDIPIGLPDHGRRAADLLARGRLPVGRKSSVFPTPTRATTAEATFPDASATSRRTTDGKGISQQAFHLVPKILEVDAFVRGGPPVTVLEAHPEVSFAALDPGCVIPSKTTADGRATRGSALRATGLEPPAYVAGRGYGPDDLLDACAVAWTAARHTHGTAYSLPDPPETFSDGLPAAIWV